MSSGIRRGIKCRVLRGLDDQGELHGRGGHFDGCLGALVLRAVDDVGPVNELGDRRGVKAEFAWRRCGPESWCRRCRSGSKNLRLPQTGSCLQSRKF